jgi:hypothetical protein
VLRTGARLSTLSDARQFLDALPHDRKTPLLYYAHVLLDKARKTRKANDIEKARGELIRALQAGDWL